MRKYLKRTAEIIESSKIIKIQDEETSVSIHFEKSADVGIFKLNLFNTSARHYFKGMGRGEVSVRLLINGHVMYSSTIHDPEELAILQKIYSKAEKKLEAYKSSQLQYYFNFYFEDLSE